MWTTAQFIRLQIEGPLRDVEEFGRWLRAAFDVKSEYRAGYIGPVGEEIALASVDLQLRNSNSFHPDFIVELLNELIKDGLEGEELAAEFKRQYERIRPQVERWMTNGDSGRIRDRDD